MTKDLFTPVVPTAKPHPQFRAVMEDHRFEAARRLMREIFTEFRDVDKSFVKEFQTGGFSARVFELALFAYLQEQGVDLDRSQPAPDFVVLGASPVAIEVTTTNPAQDAPVAEFELVPPDFDAADRAFVFQLGKALRRKLTHRDAKGRAYWEHPHVDGIPFVIAVGAFHDQHAQWFPGSLVSQYLYGTRSVIDHDTSGALTITAEQIAAHESGGRTIPSGLFRQPQAKHLAGVLFSNAHTVPMFNRIGAERGYAPADIAMCRFGTRYDPDPNATEALPFAYVIGDRPPTARETFAEGLQLFLNPWAETQLEPHALPAVTYSNWMDDGNVMTMISSDFQPFVSRTAIFEGTNAAVFARYHHLQYLGRVPPWSEVLPSDGPDKANN